jgi:hypothetical protein
MKKIILAALTAMILLSCSKQKDQKVCYWCELHGWIGQPGPDREVCLNPWEDITKQVFQDGKGNELSAQCKKQ